MTNLSIVYSRKTRGTQELAIGQLLSIS